MAKKSLSYQNRDFAFINAGRAYFAMNEYELAIDEFQKALALNPDNEELQTMVLKIKENLESRDLKDFMMKFKTENISELNQ
jgi:tetratricopeptide (TPR) repeat protein